MHYLTVQDIIWINLQITERPQRFDYAQLEEATYFQYAYGESADLKKQAARFFQGFTRNRPFTLGNQATAFIALQTFLQMNGRRFTVSDKKSAEWCTRILALEVGAPEEIESASERHGPSHEGPDDLPEVAPIALEAIAGYPKTLEALLLAPPVPH